MIMIRCKIRNKNKEDHGTSTVYFHLSNRDFLISISDLNMQFISDIIINAQMYKSAIAGQTAGPNRLKFFEGTLEHPGGNIGKKI